MGDRKIQLLMHGLSVFYTVFLNEIELCDNYLHDVICAILFILLVSKTTREKVNNATNYALDFQDFLRSRNLLLEENQYH